LRKGGNLTPQSLLDEAKMIRPYEGLYFILDETFFFRGCNGGTMRHFSNTSILD